MHLYPAADIYADISILFALNVFVDMCMCVCVVSHGSNKTMSQNPKYVILKVYTI